MDMKSRGSVDLCDRRTCGIDDHRTRSADCPPTPAVRRLRWHAGAREPYRQPVRSGRAACSGRMRALGSQHWPYAELDPPLLNVAAPFSGGRTSTVPHSTIGSASKTPGSGPCSPVQKSDWPRKTSASRRACSPTCRTHIRRSRCAIPRDVSRFAGTVPRMPCTRRHCPACRRRRLETAIRRVLPAAQRGLAGPSWWRKARAVPALGELRGDARATAIKVGYRLALSARPDGSSAPTWDGLMAATGLSRRSVARWIAWWHEQGFLATAEHGSRATDRPEWNLPGEGTTLRCTSLRPPGRPLRPMTGKLPRKLAPP